MFTRAWLTSLPDLATVAEQAIDEAQLQAETAAAEQEAALAADDSIDFRRRESAQSGFSGTTAKTSFSQEEIADLDPDVMVDVLPNLATAAEQLTKLLVPVDPKARPVVWKEIRKESTRHRKLLNNRISSLEVHKKSFGSQEYLQPSIVLRGLLGVQTMEEVPHGPWRPDNIIYSINLAQMLRATLVEVIDPSEVDADGYETLCALLNSFPNAVAGHAFDVEAFRTCLALQTQLAVARLHIFHEHPDYNPNMITRETFFKRDDDGNYIHLHCNTLGLENISNAQKTAWNDEIGQLVRGLQEPFSGDEVDVRDALAAVKMAYPWQPFVDQTVRYYEVRKAKLEREIATAGGLDVVVVALATEIERRATDKRVAGMRQSFGRPGGTPKKAMKGIAALKAREKRLSQAAPVPEPAPVAQMDPRLTQGQETAQIQDDGWIPPPENDYAEQPVEQPTAQQRARSTLEHLSGFQNLQRQNAKGKGRSFVDRQDTAQRITFDDSQSQQLTAIPGRSSALGPYHISSSRSSGKRPYDEVQEFIPTQDEGFQTDMRDTTAADQRRMAMPRPQQRRAQPASSAGTVDYEYPGSATVQLPSSKRQRKNPGSTLPDPPPSLDPEDGTLPREQRYHRAKAQAKFSRVTASQNRPTQVRTPWSQDEENALIALIEDHGGEGVSYAALKKQNEQEDNSLGRRSAEDMRFKARNMKQTFLAYVYLQSSFHKQGRSGWCANY